MGYSIYTTACSEKSFLHASKIMQAESERFCDQCYVRFAVGTDTRTGLAYTGRGKGKFYIGFDYSAGLGHCFAWQYACMLALTVGRRRKFTGIERSCPYVIYDGDDTIPVIHERLPNLRNFVIVNKIGELDLTKDRYTRLIYGKAILKERPNAKRIKSLLGSLK